MYLIIHVLNGKYTVTDYDPMEDLNEAKELITDLNTDAEENGIEDRWEIFTKVND